MSATLRLTHKTVQREEHLADLSPVLHRSQPGHLAPPRVGPLRALPSLLPNADNAHYVK